jgi:hypothetical protein
MQSLQNDTGIMRQDNCDRGPVGKTVKKSVASKGPSCKSKEMEKIMVLNKTMENTRR